MTGHQRVPAITASHEETVVRAAELVELSERVYRDVFRAGLWAAIVTAVYALALVAVQVGQIDRMLAAGICIVIALGLLAAARRHSRVYELLRRRPYWAVATAAAIAAAHVAIGPGSEILLPLTLIVLGVVGAAVSIRVVFPAALLVAAAQASPVLIYDLSPHDERSLLSAAAAILFAPMLFGVLLDRLARFMLDLHHAIATAATVRRAPDRGSRTSRRPLRRGYVLTRSDAPRSQWPTIRVTREPPEASPLALVPTVTARQRQVILLASTGQRHAEIAACLAISTGQVTRHLARARARVGVDTTEQLVAWAIGAGLTAAPVPE